MKRANSGFGLRAVIVESLGAMLLLYLLFPLADRPIVSESPSSETVASEMAAETVVVNPVSSQGAIAAEEPFRRLPTLHLPAPPAGELLTPTATKHGETRTAAQSERREFVERELEYSRRALAMMLQQHLQQLAEPFSDRAK